MAAEEKRSLGKIQKHFVREGEAPAEPLTANGSPGGSLSHTLTRTSKDFPKLA
jgi:hypothetical protein